MKKLLLIICLIGATFFSIFGQVSPPASANSGETSQQARDSRDRDIQANERLRTIQDPRNDPQYQINRANALNRTHPFDLTLRSNRNYPDIYRKTKKGELAAIKPEQEDFATYAEILRQPKTGLIRLITDTGCDDNRNVVSASNDCLKYTMPGSGASYSFRVKDYRIKELADLTFIDDSLSSLGTDVQGILTTIGDIPLEKVDFQTQGLNFLQTYNPEVGRKVKELREEFANGVVKDNFTYRSNWRVIENTTYVLRSIAYSGLDWEQDKRKDVVVAFRIVRKSQDGSITILWKELARKDSPKIKGSK